MEKNWYRNFAHVKPILIKDHNISPEQLSEYVLTHILDEMQHSEKFALLNHFYGNPTVIPTNKYETMISGYLQDRMFRNETLNKWGIILVDKNDVSLYIRSLDDTSPQWVSAEVSEFKYFKSEIAKRMIIDKSTLHRVVGYIIVFKNDEIVFKHKDITMARNKLGARCDSAGKTEILKMINMVIGAPEPTYTNTNTEDVLFHPHLCVMMEILLREYTRIKRHGKVYYLTPEQTIMNEITKYSTSASS
jgi:hypothetical protein